MSTPPRNPREASIIAQLSSVVEEFRWARREGNTQNPFNLSDEEIQALLTRAWAAVRRAAPQGSVYLEQAEELSSYAREWQLVHLGGILIALKADYEGGYIEAVEGLIYAAVFDDMLDMASELLRTGYHDPAAVIAGSVLEEHLRKLAGKTGVPTTDDDGRPRKAERLNQDLAKAAAYNVLEQKTVTSLLDLRNKAAHGHYEQYDAQHVDLMLQNVRTFVGRYALS